MEPFFSVLRLRSPASRRFLYADRTEYSRGLSPASVVSAPSSPLPGYLATYDLRRELEEASFGEVFAAIPFSWEETPGTPLRTFRSKIGSGGEADEIDRANFGSPSSSETRDESSPVGSSDQFSQTDSELESPVDAPGSAALSGSMVEGKFELKSDQPVAASSPLLASPQPMSTPDELLFKCRPVPILSLPPRLQRLEVTSQTSSPLSNDSSSSANDSSSRSAWSKQHLLSPFARSPARPPARSLYQSGSNKKSKPASILMTLFRTAPRTSTSLYENDMLDSDNIPMSAGTAKERTGRRLERRSHRRSRSGSPLSRFKRDEMSGDSEMVPVFFTTHHSRTSSPRPQSAVQGTQASKSRTKYSSVWSFNQKRTQTRPSIPSKSSREVVSRSYGHETTKSPGVSPKSKQTQICKEETKTKKQPAINCRNNNVSPKEMKSKARDWKGDRGVSFTLFFWKPNKS